MAQHQQLGLISGAVAEGCEGDVHEEPEAGVKDEEEHGRRLIVAGRGASPLSSDGLSAPHTLVNMVTNRSLGDSATSGGRREVLGEYSRAQLARAGYPRLVEDCLQVIGDGVERDP